MGLFDDMVKAMQEAADEAQARRTAQAAPQPLFQPQPRQVVRVNRRTRDAEAVPVAPPPVAPAPTRPSAAPPAPPKADTAIAADRLRRLLQQPKTIRELMVLSEVLGPPLAMRPGRRARQPFRTRPAGHPPATT